MNTVRIAAIVCFAIALLLYGFASSGKVAIGFGFLGYFFEALGWITLADSASRRKK